MNTQMLKVIKQIICHKSLKLSYEQEALCIEILR